MIKINPNSLLKKYKKREKRKTWRPKEAGDKLSQFLSGSIERKPFFSEEIEGYLKKQLLTLVKKEGQDFGRLKEYKKKLYFQTTEEFDDFYNSLTEYELKTFQRLGEKLLHEFLIKKIKEKLEELRNG